MTILVAVTQRPARALDTHLVGQTVLIGRGAGDCTLASDALEAWSALSTCPALLDWVAAGSERVPGEAWGTRALGLVTDHGTHRVTAAAGHTRAARVSALVVDTGLILGTRGG